MDRLTSDGRSRAIVIAESLFASETFLGSGQEVCFGRSMPDPEGTLGTRMGPGRAGMAPTSGPGWAPKCCKTKHMANLDGTPSDPGLGPGRAQDRTQARVWMAPPETVPDS